ncbi:MAG TPA: DUF167 domain-containing protein [Burkholderiales bacterium]|nr:DUF167 domain-containing protein [Burkholderiales bacterium]
MLALHVQPGAKRTGIAGLHGDRLKVRLAAPAVEGRANAELVAFLAERFDLPGGQVMIRSGDHGRSKTIEIHGRADRLLARVKELLQA